MTNGESDRLDRIEAAIVSLIESQRAQLEIGQNVQLQIQLQQQQQQQVDRRLREIGEYVNSVSAQVEQLYQIVMRRENNGA